MIRLILLVVLLWPGFAMAQAEPTADETLPQLRGTGSNYFAANVLDGRSNEQGTIKWRLQVARELVDVNGFPELGRLRLDFTFALLAQWDLLNRLEGSRSSPFLEHNYSPGAVVVWTSPWAFEARGGVEHESNGLGLVGVRDDRRDGRSWNRVYLGAGVDLIESRLASLRIDSMVWQPFLSSRVRDWGGRHIEDYRGVWQARVSSRTKLWAWADWLSSVTVQQRSMMVEFRWRLGSRGLILGPGNVARIDVYSQCFVGRGERLIVADEYRRACYFGLGF